ncbi:MAG: hypothetical protein P8M20_13205 [Planctomycetaceae bacterium]|nr:hypothetical protein [Planctomycetaceae bacterium]
MSLESILLLMLWMRMVGQKAERGRCWLVESDSAQAAESIVYGRQLAATTSDNSSDDREPAVTQDNRYSASGSPRSEIHGRVGTL